jgi:hypothetical protein
VLEEPFFHLLGVSVVIHDLAEGQIDPEKVVDNGNLTYIIMIWREGKSVQKKWLKMETLRTLLLVFNI